MDSFSLRLMFLIPLCFMTFMIMTTIPITSGQYGPQFQRTTTPEPLENLECYECRGPTCDKPKAKDLKICSPYLAFPACYTLITRTQRTVNRFCASAVETPMICSENDQGIDCYCRDSHGCNYLSAAQIIDIIDYPPRRKRRRSGGQSLNHRGGHDFLSKIRGILIGILTLFFA